MGEFKKTMLTNSCFNCTKRGPKLTYQPDTLVDDWVCRTVFENMYILSSFRLLKK